MTVLGSLRTSDWWNNRNLVFGRDSGGTEVEFLYMRFMCYLPSSFDHRRGWSLDPVSGKTCWSELPFASKCNHKNLYWWEVKVSEMNKVVKWRDVMRDLRKWECDEIKNNLGLKSLLNCEEQALFNTMNDSSAIQVEWTFDLTWFDVKNKICLFGTHIFDS